MCLLLANPRHTFAQKKEKAKSNRKELRELRWKTRNNKGDKAYRGDITGRRLKKRSPRSRSRSSYAQPNPYAGRKSMNEKQRMKYVRSSPRFSNKPRERAGRGPIYSNRSVRTTFTGKNAYRHDVIRSVSRGSERSVKRQRIVPRTTSGAYVVRKRSKPYAWRDRTPWESAYKGDIAGRPVRVKRTTDRPKVQAAPRLANRSYKRRGDKAYSGRISGGYLSISGQRREKAYRGPSRGYLSATKPSEKAWKGDIAGFKIQTIRTKRPKWRSVDGQQYYTSGPVDDTPYTGKIKGRDFITSRRSSEREGLPKFRGKFSLSLKGSPTNFSGNMRRRRPQQGGGSFARGQWNNKGRPLDNRKVQSQDIKVARFTGNIRGRKPGKGGGSVSTAGWNNKGRPIDNRKIQSQDVQIARFSGNMPTPGKPYDGRNNYSVGFRMHNNKGKPIRSLGHSKQDTKIAGFTGNIKGRRGPEKGAGKSVSVLPWNNDGKPLERRPVSAEARRATVSTGTVKRTFTYKKNPLAHEDALKKRGPGSGYKKAGEYTGDFRMKSKYQTKPHAADGSMKGIGPSRAMMQASAYQGNVKMSKTNLKNRHPSHKFERERTTAKSGFNLKLFWSKVFKKQENQPGHLKENVRKPRFDKGEKGLWNE